MRRFERRSGVISTRLSGAEVELLTSLVSQLVELVSGGEPADYQAADETTDAFERLVEDLQVDPDEPEVSEDPVLRRLFPNAYPHDSNAASDFRRFTERELRTTKVGDAQTVLAALTATRGGSRRVAVQAGEVEAWLRTLTAVRLAMATRLDITDAESAERLADLPESDPRTYLISVYDWLGFAQETMLSAL